MSEKKRAGHSFKKSYLFNRSCEDLTDYAERKLKKILLDKTEHQYEVSYNLHYS